MDLPDVCLLNQHPRWDLILQLYDIDCIMFGNFVQASVTFPYYVDLRKIVPQIFHQILSVMEYPQRSQLWCDKLQGIL